MTPQNEPYNYDTFVRSSAEKDFHFPGGPHPGETAPDFELPNIHGGQLRLSEHRGKPVLLTFGSIT